MISLFFYRPQALTNTFSKVCIFFVIKNATIDLCPHYRFAAFSTVHALKRSTTNCTLGRKLNHMCMRQAHAPAIFSVLVFILVRFSTANTNTICGFVLIHFHEHFQIDAAQRISVDERPKRIQMCAFSNERSPM